MLFDLRSRGRRRTIQVIYLFLAILMGGGLVFFGIGGGTGNGGLLDAVGQGGGGSSNGASIYASNVRSAQRRTTQSPNDPAAWAALTKAQFQVANTGENYNQASGTFTAKGRTVLTQVKSSWEHYLSLKPAKPDAAIAGEAVQALAGLGDYAGAVSAQEIVVGSDGTGAGQYYRLALLSYLAGQSRKGDLSAAKAVSLAPKDQQAQLKQQLAQDKTQAQQQAAQQAQKQLGVGRGAQLPQP